MAGIYSIIYKDKTTPKDNYKRFYSSKFDHTINEEFRYEDLIFGRSTLDELSRDRFIEETSELIICIEGVIYNANLTKESFVEYYNDEGIDFIKNLSGQFCGFVFDKRINKLFIFNDHLSTKPIYYHINRAVKLFCFASECKFISSFLNDVGHHSNLDYDSLKLLLSFGYLLDERTPIKEAKKLLPGSILEFDLEKFEIRLTQYFTLKKTKHTLSKNGIIERIDELAVNSVQSEWQTVQNNNLPQYAHLSGGLDSRVNILLAHELGFDNINTITFSKSNTLDHRIANQISRSINSNHHFYELTEEFLSQPIQNLVEANDGLNLFFNAAHTFIVSSFFNLQSAGAVHTGQIGDVLFGSFSNKPPLSSATIGKLGFRYENEIFQSVSNITEIIDRYDFEGGAELFSIEQRQINGTMTGDRIVSHLVDHLSPFYNKDLLSFCYSIPDEFKKNEQIYLDWFNKKHPEVANFKWQKSGTKPRSQRSVKLGLFRKKLLRHLYKIIGSQYDDMNPFQLWFNSNYQLNKYYSCLFNELINMDFDKELKATVTKTFKSDNVIDKMTAISVLYTIKLYTNQ